MAANPEGGTRPKFAAAAVSPLEVERHGKLAIDEGGGQEEYVVVAQHGPDDHEGSEDRQAERELPEFPRAPNDCASSTERDGRNVRALCHVSVARRSPGGG